MMCTTFKNITYGPTKGILKLFFQHFIMHRNGPGTSCTTFYGDKRPGRSDWSADMGPIACASAGRGLCASDALEDQGLALRLTDLWQAQGGSQRGRPTRVGKLTEKRVRFGRRAPGLTFGTTMTTSSVPVALRAASQKVLVVVPKYRQSTVWHKTSSSGPEPIIKRALICMERHGLHAYKERLGVPFAPSRSGPAKPRTARPFRP